MTKEEAISRCRKINELVKRGVDGEQVSAQYRLKSLMAKYGIEPHEIEGEKIVESSLICTKEERLFAMQVIASVLGKGFRGGKYRKRYYFDAPESKIAEIQDRWNHYRNLWEKEKEVFYSAFVQKHKLYAKSTGEKDDHTPLTPEEKAKLLRMFQMMEGMEYSDYKKKLNK
jgi:hypothetical protein